MAKVILDGKTYTASLLTPEETEAFEKRLRRERIAELGLTSVKTENRTTPGEGK